jgi:hypothetical protein
MNIGSVESGEYIKLFIDGVNFHTSDSLSVRESTWYCCENLH